MAFRFEMLIALLGAVVVAIAVSAGLVVGLAAAGVAGLGFLVMVPLLCFRRTGRGGDEK